MKYAITHCYTDHNKGDAAIIISTVQLLRKKDKAANISMFSTFGPNDKQYQNEHSFVSKYADGFYPGMFYQPRPTIGNSDFSRLIHFLWILLKFGMLLLSHNKFIMKFLFTELEREGVTAFLDSDVIISKGGSYITSQNTSIRQSISLFSMLYPFLLAKRYKKRIVIFSQSLGPINGSFNKWLSKKALSGIDNIYLRENFCLEEYEEVREIGSAVNIDVIPDTAFYLTNDCRYSKHNLEFNPNRFNVGMTIVDHAFKYVDSELEREIKINKYKYSLIDNIKYMIEKFDALIHIFPQVISNNSHKGHSDVRISREIALICKELGYVDRVTYHEGDYNPMQLRDMYKQMDMFIGTRLHSVIFSLSLNVPSINIAYHGTKSQGILKAINGFEDYVLLIDDINSDALRDKIDLLYKERFKLAQVLELENKRIRDDLEKAIDGIFLMSKC